MRREPFGAILDVFLAHGKGALIVIEAYIDESERPDGTFCVAGYCYFPAKAKRLNKKWRAILGGRTFHATDMNCGQGEFKDLDKETSSAMYRSLIGAIREHAELGAVFSVNTKEVTVKWPDLDGFRTAYAVCCVQVINTIAQYLSSRDIKSRVAYVFEAGHRDQGEAKRVMEAISESVEPRKTYYHYLSHAFIGKSDMVLLQTADLLAWEWSKFISETGLDERAQKRPLRQSLRSLLIAKSGQHLKYGHLTNEMLEEHFAIMEQLCPPGSRF